MASFDEPVFENWDQDRAAVDTGYRLSDPSLLSTEFAGWARAAAAVFEAVPEAQSTRGGLRSDGVRFTIETFGANVVHELEHHLRDAGGSIRSGHRDSTERME